ncbi:MAG: protease SohB [Bdellovibrionales bacterium]|nr:protease SohB [Bdellovibrionales bacterium]
MDQLIEFGVFSGKLLIVFLFIMALVLLVATLIMKQKLKPDLIIENINEKLDELEQTLKSTLLDKKELKNYLKEQKKKLKDKESESKKTPCLFVLEFKGDIHAHAVKELRDEVTAVLTVANPDDEVLVTIESPGGTVHGYGLAAAQLIRVKDAGLKLTACVDLVAASGGYMMACTAHKIIAAPFSIIGSIGVLAQVPNFHKLLKKNDVDYEEISSGEYKRTVSILGEITEKGRAKFQEQIVDTHALFKDFVGSSRPQTDMSKVATGEYWYGVRAKELNLVDELMTSDQYLLSRKTDAKIFKIKYQAKKSMSEKISDVLGHAAVRATDRITEKLMETPRL